MRIRSLKPEFFTDRVTGRWPAELALFYQALWVLADDEGRFEWEPEGIRGQVFPYRSLIDPCALMEELRKTGHVVKYSANGEYYGWLPKFKRHQHPNRPQESKLPDPSVSTHIPLSESSVSKPCKRSLVEESRVRDLESSGGERSGEERRDLRSSDHPCVLEAVATRDEAAGAAREVENETRNSLPEKLPDATNPSKATLSTGGPPTEAATTGDDLDPPPCPGPPEFLAHEEPPLSSAEPGQLGIAAVPPAEASGEERRSPATSPPLEPIDRLIEVWDRVCVPAGFARVRKTDAQRKKARARMREKGWFEAFEEACAHVATDSFYRGGGDRGWIMTFGWLLEPGHAEKTAERAQTTRASLAKPKLCFEPAESFEEYAVGEIPIT
jgi:hypothetical protein